VPLLALLAPSSSAGDNGSLFSAGANVELANFALLNQPTPAIAFGIRTQYMLSTPAFVEVAAAFGDFEESFDTPGGTGSFAVGLWWVELGFGHSLFSIGNSMDVLAQVGTGITTFSHDDLVIPLGATGSYTLSRASETHMHYFIGLRVTQRLTNNVSLFAGSNLKFLAPLSAPQPSHTFIGGITVDIL